MTKMKKFYCTKKTTKKQVKMLKYHLHKLQVVNLYKHIHSFLQKMINNTFSFFNINSKTSP
jgi:hypothetical protein